MWNLEETISIKLWETRKRKARKEGVKNTISKNIFQVNYFFRVVSQWCATWLGQTGHNEVLVAPLQLYSRSQMLILSSWSGIESAWKEALEGRKGLVRQASRPGCRMPTAVKKENEKARKATREDPRTKTQTSQKTEAAEGCGPKLPLLFSRIPSKT